MTEGQEERKCKKCGKVMAEDKYASEKGIPGRVWTCTCGYICGEIPIEWSGKKA